MRAPLAAAAGAEVHARDDEALRAAAEQGHPAVVQILLAAGAMVEVGGILL